MAKIKTVMIAGGGTGGHIYPGVAIAKELLKLNPQLKVEFVGTAQGMEKNIIPKEGFRLHLVRSAKLNNQNLLGKIKSLLWVTLGLMDSLVLVLKCQPDFVLGVGGYASGPFVMMARLLGKKTALWEPNAMPGMANRLLSHIVDTSFLVFEESKKKLKSKSNFVLGMPIREEIEVRYLQKKIRAPQADGSFSLLIFCGSQGAKRINETVVEVLKSSLTEFSKMTIYHQIGQANFADMKNKYNELCRSHKGEFQEDKNTFIFPHGLKIQIFDFIYNMPELYDKADMVICRGGASSLAEVAANRLPALIIPLAVADSHQERNAEQFVRSGAAEMCLQKDLTAEVLKNSLLSFKNDPGKRLKYSENIEKLFTPQAGKEIAQKILLS